MAFLLYWICRYLIYFRFKKPIKAYLKIAITLAEGRTIALRPECQTIHGDHHFMMKYNIYGILWWVYTWIITYFEEFSNIREILNLDSIYKENSPLNASFENTFFKRYTKTLISFIKRIGVLISPFTSMKTEPLWAFSCTKN